MSTFPALSRVKLKLSSSLDYSVECNNSNESYLAAFSCGTVVLFIMLHKVILTLKFVNETRDHENKSYYGLPPVVLLVFQIQWTCIPLVSFQFCKVKGELLHHLKHLKSTLFTNQIDFVAINLLQCLVILHCVQGPWGVQDLIAVFFFHPWNVQPLCHLRSWLITFCIFVRCLICPFISGY